MPSAIIVVGDNLDIMPIEAAVVRAGGGFYARVPDLAAASWLLAAQASGAIVILQAGLLQPLEQRRWRDEHGAASVLSTRSTRSMLFQLRLALALRARVTAETGRTPQESWS